MSADLTTTYLGLSLKNPIIASAGPLTDDQDTLRRLDHSGVAAAVLPSLFEEQICMDKQRLHLHEYPDFPLAESLTYYPKTKDYQLNPRDYLNLIDTAVRTLSIRIIASLNGSTPGGWVRYAKLMESYGAHAIELNIYFLATDPQVAGADVEKRYVDLVARVCSAVNIPIAVKLGPQLSSLSNFVPQLAQAGAKGVVLFNRFLEPDIDLETMQLSPQVVLSSPHEFRAALRWIAILRNQVSISLGATGGIHRSDDVIKLVLAGADACLINSALLQNGLEYVGQMLRGMETWLDQHHYQSIEEIKGGLSYSSSPGSGSYERANYMKAIVAYSASH